MILEYAMFIEDYHHKEYDKQEEFVVSLCARKLLEDFKYHIKIIDDIGSMTIKQFRIFECFTYYVKYSNIAEFIGLNELIHHRQHKYSDYERQLGLKGRYDYEIKDYLKSKL